MLAMARARASGSGLPREADKLFPEPGRGCRVTSGAADCSSSRRPLDPAKGDKPMARPEKLSTPEPTSLQRATAAQKTEIWRKVVAKAREANRSPRRTDENVDAYEAVVTNVAHAIWAAGVRNWDDVTLYAEMARYLAF